MASGRARIGRWCHRDGPDSDVTRGAKAAHNAGRSVAAGVVTGARLGRLSDSNATDWECGSSRKRPTRSAMLPARQWGLVRHGFRWLLAQRKQATTKGLTGNPVEKTCSWSGSRARGPDRVVLGRAASGRRSSVRENRTPAALFSTAGAIGMFPMCEHGLRFTGVTWYGLGVGTRRM